MQANDGNDASPLISQTSASGSQRCVASPVRGWYQGMGRVDSDFSGRTCLAWKQQPARGGKCNEPAHTWPAGKMLFMGIISKSAPPSVCVLLCFVDPILGNLTVRGHSLSQGTWGCWMLTLHLNYVAGYTGPLLFLFERTHNYSVDNQVLLPWRLRRLGRSKVRSDSSVRCVPGSNRQTRGKPDL